MSGACKTYSQSRRVPVAQAPDVCKVMYGAVDPWEHVYGGTLWPKLGPLRARSRPGYANDVRKEKAASLLDIVSLYYVHI